MRQAIVSQQQKGYYSPTKYQEDEAGILAHFLAYHIINEDFFFSSWLDNPEEIYEEKGNYGYVKMKNNNIHIGLSFNRGKGKTTEVVLNKEVLKKTIKDWIQIQKKNPKEILISYDKNYMLIEPKL